MSEAHFMPKATAVWLVENTTLTFKQIAEFCNLHELEVKGIADGDVAKGIKSFKKGMASDVTDEESPKNISENQDSNNQDSSNKE